MPGRSAVRRGPRIRSVAVISILVVASAVATATWAASYQGTSTAVAPGPLATLPGGFFETQITGLSNPTAMALAPDGRIFVCEQGGNLRVIKNGALLATPFLTVTVSSVGERGLLGVAFDPNSLNNQLAMFHGSVCHRVALESAAIPSIFLFPRTEAEWAGREGLRLAEEYF